MTRGEIWAGFAAAVAHGGWTVDFSAEEADGMMAEYDKRFDDNGDEKRQEGA